MLSLSSSSGPGTARCRVSSVLRDAGVPVPRYVQRWCVDPAYDALSTLAQWVPFAGDGGAAAPAPEGLLPTVTISLMIAARKMTKRQARGD